MFVPCSQISPTRPSGSSRPVPSCSPVASSMFASTIVAHWLGATYPHATWGMASSLPSTCDGSRTVMTPRLRSVRSTWMTIASSSRRGEDTNRVASAMP